MIYWYIYNLYIYILYMLLNIYIICIHTSQSSLMRRPQLLIWKVTNCLQADFLGIDTGWHRSAELALLLYWFSLTLGLKQLWLLRFFIKTSGTKLGITAVSYCVVQWTPVWQFPNFVPCRLAALPHCSESVVLECSVDACSSLSSPCDVNVVRWDISPVIIDETGAV